MTPNQLELNHWYPIHNNELPKELHADDSIEVDVIHRGRREIDELYVRQVPDGLCQGTLVAFKLLERAESEEDRLIREFKEGGVSYVLGIGLYSWEEDGLVIRFRDGALVPSEEDLKQMVKRGKKVQAEENVKYGNIHPDGMVAGGYRTLNRAKEVSALNCITHIKTTVVLVDGEMWSVRHENIAKEKA